MPPNNNTGIEFALFAPYNEEVSLRGSWNNFEPQPMTRGKDGWWRASVPLDDGDYAYRFRVRSKSWFAPGEYKEVADPRATELTEDPFENACLKVRRGQRVITAHQWKHDNTPLPPNERLVIYELHVGDFTGGPGDEPEKGQRKGRFVDVIDRLDYLADLGINCIEFMPVNEFPHERSWGYEPFSLFAVENTYGSADDFCRLVDECHARGIRVFMDAVFNHMHPDSPLAQIDHDYWFHHEPPHPPDQRYGADFNYEHWDPNLNIHPARQYVKDALRHWLEHFRIDGIRFDATYLINNYDILRELQAEVDNTVEKIKPFLTIAENLPQNPAVCGPEGPLDAAWHENLYYQLNAAILGVERNGRQPHNIDALLQVIDCTRDGFSSPRDVVNYIDNHDKDRILWELGAHAFTFDAAAFRRMKLGAALLLTMPGLPMIWMGQEFGEAAPKTLDWQRLDWALLKNEANRNLRDYYRKLIHLRTSTPALYGETFELCGRYDDRGIFAFKRWNNEGNVAVIVANLMDQYAGEFTFGWPDNGAWRECVWDYDVEVHNNSLTDTLAESEVKIYVKK